MDWLRRFFCRLLGHQYGFRLHDGSAELAARLRTLVDDPALRARMGARSRELITTRFSFQHFLDTVTSVVHAEANGDA